MREVQKLTKDTIPEAAALERICFAEPWSEKSLELLTGNEASGEILLSPDGTPLAYGGIFWAPDEGQITNIAVSPNARRMGFGRKILNALLDDARAKHCKTVVLEVRKSNLPAISLYESVGFCRVGERKNFYKNPREDALIYEIGLLGTEETKC